MSPSRAEQESTYRLAVERLEGIDEADLERIHAAFESDESPAHIDWGDFVPERPLATVLEQLARVKMIVPENNQFVHPNQHNRTVEHHIMFALEVAGTQENLELYLELLKGRLEQEDSPGREELAQQALLIWAPAAEINGWYGTKTELENLAFPILYKDEAAKIEMMYAADAESIDKEAQAYAEMVRLCLGHDLPAMWEGYEFTIQRRVKTPYSVWRRAERKRRARKERSIDYQIPDFIGIRVIVGSWLGETRAIERCYAIAGSIGGFFDHETEGWQRDHIDLPKPNDYQSLHLRLQDSDSEFEVQVRTSAMHRLAEEDPNMSHMAYEASKKVTPGRVHNRGLLKPPRHVRWRDEAAQMIRESGGRLTGLRPDRVLAFLWDGNLYELNAGDTMLDFVFGIQDHRALRTESIRANDRQTGFETPLRFGDRIEFYCGPDQQWKESWVGKTRSPRARKRLRIVREQSRAEEYRQSGARLIEERFASLGIDDPLGVLTEEDEQELVRKYGLHDFEAILRKIGLHADTLRQIARKDLKPEHAGADLVWPDRVVKQIQLRLDANRKEAPETTAELLSARRLSESDEGDVEITGLQGCEYHLGGCCNPRPGSEIVATASQINDGRTLTVHRTTCDQFDSNRALSCAWKAAA